MTKTILDNAAIIFKVSKDIQTESVEKYETKSVRERIETSDKFKDYKVESSSNSDVVSQDLPHKLTINGFAEAVHLAYASHHGLALSPDHIFITILQGLSIHIDLDPETHRSSLGLGHTKPGTKDKIDVRRDEFVLGNPNNDWQGTFPEFSQKISEKVGEEVHSLLAPAFSTSDPLAVAVCSLTIMDVFKNYFEYSITTMCGIPEIALLGSQQDWIDLKEKVVKLLTRVKGLDFWSKELFPVLDKFIEATGSDRATYQDNFWTNIYKPSGGSGGPYIHGWISVLFPYLQNHEEFTPNSHLDWSAPPSMFSGLTYDKFPAGITRTPFTWNYYHDEFPMIFVGGFLGAEKLSNSFLMPSLSWAVLHEPKE